MLQWSSDGTRLAGVGGGNDIVIWDVEARELTSVVVGDGGVCGLAWSPSSNRLAAASGDLLRVWDVPDGSVVSELQVEFRIDNIAWSPSSVRIAIIDTGSIKLVNSVTADVVAVIVVDTSEHTYELAWSPDGRFIAGSRGIRGVRVWDVASGAIAGEFGSGGSVLPIAWSPDGSCLAAGSRGGGIGLWDPATKDVVWLERHRDGIEMLSWAPDSRRLASTGEDGAVRIWDRDQMTSYDLVEAQRFDGSRVYWGASGHLAVVPGDGRSATLWDVEARRVTPLIAVGEGRSIRQVISWSPDGAILALSDAEEVVVWDIRGGRSSRRLGAELIAVGPRCSGPALAWAKLHGTGPGLRHWEVGYSRTVTGRPSKALTLDVGWIDGLSWSPDGAMLAIVTGDRVLIWQLDAGLDRALDVDTPGGSDSIGTVQWSRNGERLAATYGYRNVVIWAVPTGSLLARLSGPRQPSSRSRPAVSDGDAEGFVSAVAWTEDGDLIAAGSGGSKVWHGIIWAATGPQPRRSRKQRAQPVSPAVNWIDFDGAVEVAVSGSGQVAVVDRNGWTTVLDGAVGRPLLSVNSNNGASAWVDADGGYGLMAATDDEPPIWVLSGFERYEVAGTPGLKAKKVGPSANPCRRVGGAWQT